MNLKIKYLLGLFLLCLNLNAADFRIGINKQKDSIQYFIVNQTSETINAGAIVCNWYHQTDSLVFWPADIYAGFGISKSTGTYYSKNTKFQFRTSQRISFDFDIAPGDSQVFVTVQNFSELPTIVMCSNVQLFYLDQNREPRDASVFMDDEFCLFKQVFVVTNLSSDGIRFWSPANQTLHMSATCTTGFYAVVIDKSTLEPIPVANVVPNCPDGRKWTSFGHPKNEQVFYHFDFRDTQHIQGFVDFVDAIRTGDHVFFINAQRDYIDFRDPRVIKAFESLGSKKDMRGNYLYVSKVWGAYGNKGSDSGTLEWFNDEVLRKEYFLLPNQVYDSMVDFSPCFEKTIKQVDKTQGLYNSTKEVETTSIKIYPNPAQGEVVITGFNRLKSFSIFNIEGRVVEVPFVQEFNQLKMNLSILSEGIYIVDINGTKMKMIKTD